MDVGHAELGLELSRELDDEVEVDPLADGADVLGALALGLDGGFALREALHALVDHLEDGGFLTGCEAAPVAQAGVHLAEELADRGLHQRVSAAGQVAFCVGALDGGELAVLEQEVDATLSGGALLDPAGARALGAVGCNACMSASDVSVGLLDVVRDVNVGHVFVAHLDLHQRSPATI